jgi:hypothetical protein
MNDLLKQDTAELFGRIDHALGAAKGTHGDRCPSGPRCQAWTDFRLAEEALAALKERMEQAERLQFRCLWEEVIGGEWYWFSGKVGTFENTSLELESRRSLPRCRNVSIEVRVKRPGEAWPRPWDDAAMRETKEQK